VADFERRIGRIETLVPVNTAVLAMNTALVIAVACSSSSKTRASKRDGPPEGGPLRRVALASKVSADVAL
jgi:hypothetical protein